MFGIKYVKTPPTIYMQQYVGGKIKREGQGLSFLHYAPTSTLVAVPAGTTETAFIMEVITADYQEITIQGNLTYRINEPAKIATMLDFTLKDNGEDYASEDPAKLEQRMINLVTVAIKREITKKSLREALNYADKLTEKLRPELADAKEAVALGTEILGLTILMITPKPETARALEAKVREEIYKDADDAIYFRRNAAVEQERKVKENELNTEIAVENKKKQIQDAKMDAEKAKQEKEQAFQNAETEFLIQQEAKRKDLVELETGNAKKEADARAYGMKVMMDAIAQLDVKALQAIANAGLEPEQLIANAFKELAENANKIGQLNITPDLLGQLMQGSNRR